MSFTNLSFLGIYFPILLLLYYNPIFKKNGFRKLLLAGASICLYAFCEPVYLLLLLGVILANFLLVKLSDKFASQIFRTVAIVLDSLILLFFKYINVIFTDWLMQPDFSTIAFPIGLSYFTFKAISYVVDSKEEKSGTLLDTVIYIGNFLTIVSGPLSTYKSELPYIKEKKAVCFDKVYKGFERIIIGLGKKIIIADSISILANECFSTNGLSIIMSWAGAIAYSLQLFFDFSGYTDMAIGVGLLFGFELPENFNYPYMATSVSDFWKRWHISLTKWFTKYIYFPLGGSRVNSKARHIFNLLVVWIVTGIWHGSKLTFIVWALIYFVFQVLEKYTKLSELLKKVHLGRVYALLIIIIEWVIFRSESLGKAFTYVGSMFGCTNNTFCTVNDLSSISKYAIPLLLGIILSTTLGIKFKEFISKKLVTNILYNISLILILILCLILSMSQGFSAPLYAGF